MTLAIPDRATVEAVLSVDKPVVNVSIIKPKAGRFDEFMTLQLAQHMRLRGKVEGLRGGRLFSSPASGALVLVSMFETAADAGRFSWDPRLRDHLDRVRPLIETAEAGTYDLAYAVGEV
jgi:hypothetical protein